MNFIKILRKLSCLSDILFFMPVLISGLILKIFRLFGARYLPVSTRLLRKIGVFPVLDHYYEPWFQGHVDLQNFYSEPPFALDKQLQVLSELDFSHEFRKLIDGHLSGVEYSYAIENGSFEGGDADLLYAMVRHTQPKSVIEIGCGNSTKIINAALRQNESANSQVRHLCIEPFEQPWLEKFPNIDLIRKPVEDCEIEWGDALSSNDLLFIDSSHILRPGNDVHFEYLNILPQLASGVVIHIHDIFTPRNYSEEWMDQEVRFWNEQFLLECILANSDRYEVLLSANFLKHQAFDIFKKSCVVLTRACEPGSIYLKVK